jgi:hypothetical protein
MFPLNNFSTSRTLALLVGEQVTQFVSLAKKSREACRSPQIDTIDEHAKTLLSRMV